MDNRPIGIFDSGLGGLTALSALRTLMPEENLVYFADTARNPYGTRTPEQLRRMAGENLAFLARFGVKAVIAACGTMSTNALDVLGGSEIPVVNVLEPSVAAMAAVKGPGTLAVTATDASIRSGGYTRALQRACPGRKVTALACQEFVHLCETWHTAPDDPLVREAVSRCLTPLSAAKPAALLLGCTHFGLMADAIRSCLGADVTLVSAAGCAARACRSLLEATGLTGGSGEEVLYTSGSLQEFEEKAEHFLHHPVKAFYGSAGE
ncbi:MAG: glutamate racemase [Oscillospiraceae bacterium]|nr:glutamate racemase [Oscillospiraceae bacterium]